MRSLHRAACKLSHRVGVHASVRHWCVDLLLAGAALQKLAYAELRVARLLQH